MNSSFVELWNAAGGKAPDHWPFFSIESLLEAPKSIAVGVMYPGPNTENGVPLIRVSDVKNGTVVSKPEFCVGREVDEEYKRTRLNGSELLVTLVGNPGDCVIVDEHMVGWNVARALAVVRLADTSLRTWLRYVLLSKPAQHLISSRLNTTVQKTLNLKDIRQLGLPIPPKEDRDKITRTFETIDKKIQLNQRMNRTLEEMAQAIFKCWFVDFEPTRAKMAGESEASICSRLRITPDILALFPDTMEESDYGPKPLGWRLSTIEQEVDIFGGSTPSTKNSTFWDGGTLCWSTPKDLSNSLSPVLLDTERKITEAGVMTITSGQLPKGTLLMSSRAPVGYLAIAEVPISVNQGYIAMVCEKTLSNLYMLFWAKKNMDQIKDRANGSTFQEISKKNFRPISVLVPGSQLLSEFEKACRPIYTQIVLNMRQAQTLAQIRDTLLPKLLSGEISVGQAQDEVGGS